MQIAINIKGGINKIMFSKEKWGNNRKDGI